MTVRKAILIFSPYGIALRDLLHHPTLSDFLTRTYQVDVVSPFAFALEDSWSFGWSAYGPDTYGPRISTLINHRILSTRYRSMFRSFYHSTGWAPLYRPVAPPGRPGVPNYDLWSLLGWGPAGAVTRSVTCCFPAGYPLARILEANNYSAVIVTHPTDGECTLIAESARKKSMPVICAVMGADNLSTGGPMMMRPDMLLSWGPEQTDAFRNNHAKFTPGLLKTQVETVGALAHDSLIGERTIEPFRSAYPHIDDDTVVVMFAAYVELAYPGQSDVCRMILDFFKRNRVKGHLVVRLRPGIDERLWGTFAAKNAGYVTLQLPNGTSYTKWTHKSVVKKSTELADIALYGATLRRSAIVVAATFSTVVLDAFAAGSPSVPVGIASNRDVRTHFREVYDKFGQCLPSYREVRVLTEESEFLEVLDQVLLRRNPRILLEPVGRSYRMQAGVPDGLAGRRTIDAIARLLGP